jgi:hypothetical protein
VRWIVGFSPGGSADLHARLIAQWLSERLGQQFIIENRPGASTNIALQAAVNEYTCQGLELDYVGVCWDGDLLWDDAATAWKPCRLIGSRWQTVNNADAKHGAINKYRVLLTRARIGSMIWVPEGSAEDPTRDLGTRDSIAEVLSAAGARQLN